MRKLWMLLIVILAAFSLFIVACGGDDGNNDITNPDDAEWVLMFMQVPDFNREVGYWFDAYWNGASTAITASDVFQLTIDGSDVPVELYNYDNEWSVTAYNLMLTPGSTYSVVFTKNGNTIISKSVKMPYPSTCDFPATYNPTESVSLNWTMDGNNQLQYVSVSASNWENTTDNYDEEMYQVSNSARSYTVPANAVQDLGVGTEYELGIIQMNNYFSGKVYLYTMQGSGVYYTDSFKKAQKQWLGYQR
jgi:hypothetical protein